MAKDSNISIYPVTDHFEVKVKEMEANNLKRQVAQYKRRYKNIFKLSEYFNQDSFLYKPAGTTEAKLIGTNNAERNEDFGTPGYNQKIDVGEFHPNGFEGALSKIGNKVFQFRLNENKTQNKQFLANEILCEEVFEKLTNISKAAVTKAAKKINL